MAITKNLIHFNEKTKFEEKLANNEILDTSIVFIKDTQEIYTHGQLYKCADPDLSIYLTTTNAGNTYATITTANGLQENIDDVITDLQDYKTTVASTYITPNEVDTKIAALVDSAPTTLNTLNELAAALGDDPNFATTVATNIGKKADQSALDTTNAKFNNYLPLTGGRLKGELKINTEAENDNQKFGFFKTDNSNQNNYGCLQIGTNVGAEKPIGITLSGCDPTLTANGTDKYGTVSVHDQQQNLEMNFNEIMKEINCDKNNYHTKSKNAIKHKKIMINRISLSSRNNKSKKKLLIYKDKQTNGTLTERTNSIHKQYERSLIQITNNNSVYKKRGSFLETLFAMKNINHKKL